MLCPDWDKVAHLAVWPESARLKVAIEEKKYDITYTMPGIKSDNLLKIPMEAEVQRCYDQYFCRVDAELNQIGLAKLIKMVHLELALNGTTVLLSQMGHGVGKAGKPSNISPLHIELWGVRFQLLMALKLYPQLVEELLPFEDLDAPDLYYQYHPDKNKTGTMVPFSVRLINAEVLRFTPFPWKTVERIQRLEQDVESVITSLTTSLAVSSHISAWKERLLAVKRLESRVLFALGEYMLSMNVLDGLRYAADDKEKAVLSRAMFRMALSVGDERVANANLEEAAKEQGTDLLFHKALRSIFLGAFPHAQEYLQRAKLSDATPMIWNTEAICLLYSGKVNEAICCYSKHAQCPYEPIITNLKTTSELGNSSSEKDALLKDILKRKNA